MKKQHLIKVLAGLILVITATSCKKETAKTTANPALPKGHFTNLNSSSAYWNYAQLTHNFVYGNLLTSYNSYRVNTTANVNDAYEWYNASQIYADAAFVQAGDSRYAPFMNNSYTWIGNMWNTGSSTGGYFAGANVNGTGAGGDQYVDDNSLTGNVYLDAYNVTTGTQQAAYLASAKAIANWLMNSGQWDTTFGGGFWWHTGARSGSNVKPTQTNGLAMQFFLRLYKITGQTLYRDWANSVRTWLESNMYDSTSGLYVWQFTPDGVKHTDKFTYDNAIMVEADLLYASIMSDTSYKTKAQNLGIAMNTVLWNSTYNVYIFNTPSGSNLVNPAWCVWGSQAMIRLYEADGNTAWLNYAQHNIDYMNAKLRNNTNGGYHYFCNLDGSGVDNTRYEGVDQAWMQRTQALLSNYR